MLQVLRNFRRCSRLFLAALALLLVQTACGRASKEVLTENPALAQTQVPPQALREAAAIESALKKVVDGGVKYAIGGGDLLDISVYQEKDLARTVRVSADGTVNFPLIGSVSLGGLGVPAAERILKERLREYLKNPEVFIFIKEYGHKQIYILGEVQKPGSYALPTESTLSVLEAVVQAGGFTPYAAMDRTRVIRKVENQSQSFVIEVSAIMKRGDKSKDMTLQSNDVIYVPEKFF
jgi:polysaccharide export outer membrane protein